MRGALEADQQAAERRFDVGICRMHHINNNAGVATVTVVQMRAREALHTDRCTMRIMLVRKQIIVPSETDKRIRRLARKKGISQSALIVEAVETLPDASSQVDHVLAFAGTVKGAPRKLSEEVDEVVYR